jgi:hypothetical protein
MSTAVSRTRWPPAQWLADHGWTVSTTRAAALAQRYRRPLDEITSGPMRSSLLITARADRQQAEI